MLKMCAENPNIMEPVNVLWLWGINRMRTCFGATWEEASHYFYTQNSWISPGTVVLFWLIKKSIMSPLAFPGTERDVEAISMSWWELTHLEHFLTKPSKVPHTESRVTQAFEDMMCRINIAQAVTPSRNSAVCCGMKRKQNPEGLELYKLPLHFCLHIYELIDSHGLLLHSRRFWEPVPAVEAPKICW